MRAVDIIIKKRDKGELTLAEIEFFIKSFISGEVTDYQASALLMAIVLNGMTPRETTDLTLAMSNSGHMLDLSDVYMTVFLPESAAGRLAIGAQARLVLDVAPQYVVPAKVTFVAAEAQR